MTKAELLQELNSCKTEIAILQDAIKELLKYHRIDFPCPIRGCPTNVVCGQQGCKEILYKYYTQEMFLEEEIK